MASISIIALPGWGNVLSHGSAPWPLSVTYERSGRARALLPALPGAPAVLTLPHPHSTLAPRPVRQVLVGALLGDPHAESHGQTPRPPPLGVLFVAVATTAQAPANMHWIGILSPAAEASILLFEAFRQGDCARWAMSRNTTLSSSSAWRVLLAPGGACTLSPGPGTGGLHRGACVCTSPVPIVISRTCPYCAWS